jgi:hypothetical protein
VGFGSQENRNAVEEIIRTDPEGAATLVEVTQKLREGFYDQDYADAIFQKAWQHGEYDIYDSLAFSRVHAGLQSGDILVTKIKVYSEPVKDKHIEEMNKRLKRIENVGPFKAIFYGDKSANDGVLTWTEPIVMERVLDHEYFLVRDHNAPLEVGTTAATTTYLHLFRELSLARWPYHSEWIWLFLNAKAMAGQKNINLVIGPAEKTDYGDSLS